MLPSEELSTKLRELSGWSGEFTLGYLLRKLPKSRQWSSVLNCMGDLWMATFEKSASVYADTPEDAAAKLAIELFKQGILTKEPANV